MLEWLQIVIWIQAIPELRWLAKTIKSASKKFWVIFKIFEFLRPNQFTFPLFQKRLTETWCTHADASNLLLISKKVRIAQKKRTPTGKMSPNAFVLRANATAFRKLCLWWHQWLLHWLSWKSFIRRQFFETIYFIFLLKIALIFSENKTQHMEMDFF